jgi:hypothetical protein
MLKLFYVGRFVIRQKRVDRLNYISKKLDQLGIAHELLIIGIADDAVKNIIGDISPSLRFYGFCKNWHTVVDANSIMIFVSDYEGCPLALLEAYRFGIRKVVVLNSPGLKQYVSENCIASNTDHLVQIIADKQDFENYTQLNSFFDPYRFLTEVQNTFLPCEPEHRATD